MGVLFNVEDEDEEVFEFEESIDFLNLVFGVLKSIGFLEKFEILFIGGIYNIEVSIYKDGKKFDVQDGIIRKDMNVKIEELEVEISSKVIIKFYLEKLYFVLFLIKNLGEV